jgi:hypothetical protein
VTPGFFVARPRAAVPFCGGLPDSAPASAAAESTASAAGGGQMDFTLTAVTIQPLIALLAGILILIVPRILNYVVAIYLILIGIFGLFPNLLDNLLQ